MGNEDSMERCRSRPYRATAGWTAAGALAVVALMALSPLAMGAHSAVTLLPPFSGTSAHPGTSLYSNCGTSSVKPAHWTPSSGLVTGAGKESYSDCPGWAGEPDSYGDSWSTIAIPFHPTHVSEYNVSLTWTYKVTDAMANSGLSCPAPINYSSGYDYEYCYSATYWELNVVLSLYDVTNSTMVSNTYSLGVTWNYTDAYADTWCDYGNCSAASSSYAGSSAYAYHTQYPGNDYLTTYGSPGTISGTGSLWSNTSSWNTASSTGVNMSLIPTHKYVALIEVQYVASGYEYRYGYVYNGATYSYPSGNPASGGGSASVSGVPSGGGTAGVKFTSVTVTQV